VAVDLGLVLGVLALAGAAAAGLAGCALLARAYGLWRAQREAGLRLEYAPRAPQLAPGQTIHIRFRAVRGACQPVPDALIRIEVPPNTPQLLAGPLTGTGHLDCEVCVAAPAARGALALRATAECGQERARARVPLALRPAVSMQRLEPCPPPAWRLALLQGVGAGQVMTLGERLTIGRNPDNDLCLAYRDVSRYHAAIERDDEGYALKDLGSKTGTWLNRARLEAPAPLLPGDVIRVGCTFMRVEVEGTPRAQTEGGRVKNATPTPFAE
jgi:hypothetical protein